MYSALKRWKVSRSHCASMSCFITTLGLFALVACALTACHINYGLLASYESGCSTPELIENWGLCACTEKCAKVYRVVWWLLILQISLILVRILRMTPSTRWIPYLILLNVCAINGYCYLFAFVGGMFLGDNFALGLFFAAIFLWGSSFLCVVWSLLQLRHLLPPIKFKRI